MACAPVLVIPSGHVAFRTALSSNLCVCVCACVCPTSKILIVERHERTRDAFVVVAPAATVLFVFESRRPRASLRCVAALFSSRRDEGPRRRAPSMDPANVRALLPIQARAPGEHPSEVFSERACGLACSFPSAVREVPGSGRGGQNMVSFAPPACVALLCDCPPFLLNHHFF